MTATCNPRMCDHAHSPEFVKEFGRWPTILGVDPGLSTGVAVAYFGTETKRYNYITSTHTEVGTVLDLVDVPVELVIIERFSAALIDKYGLHTVDLVGGVKAMARHHGITLIEHTPTQRKPYIEYAASLVPPDEGVTRHDQRHEIDALSHIVRWLYQRDYITSLRVNDG
jgi:hypothetical protein